MGKDLGIGLRKLLILSVIQALFVLPVFALDLDSTVNDKTRNNYSKQTVAQPQTQNKTVEQQSPTATSAQGTKAESSKPEVKPQIKKDLPNVPALPSNVNSATVAPINLQYSGKVPNEEALIPCNNIKKTELIIDNRYAGKKSSKQKIATSKTKNQTQNYRTVRLAKGTQIRVINQSKITDYLTEGQGIVFLSTQEVQTPYLTIPKNTKFTARIVDSHRPQVFCNGGLVGIRIVSANINNYNQTLDGGITILKTDKVYFSNLKGEHTYKKNVCKKAKWGQNKFNQYSKTSHKLANNGAGVIIAPFPYLGGCVLAAASTISSPVTALLGKGGSINIPAKTTFTIKLYNDAKIRY